MNWTAISAILGIIIPVMVAYISTRHNFRKHPRQEFSEGVEAAKEFDSITSSSDSQLVKDRVTQKLIVNKEINFIEAKFFYQYVDMGLWIDRYISVRSFIDLIVDENNNIIELTEKNKLKTRIYFFILYVFFAALALFPFLFRAFYLSFWDEAISSKQYLISANLVVWPIIFMSLAFNNLYKSSKTSDAAKFLKRFKKESIKVKSGSN